MLVTSLVFSALVTPRYYSGLGRGKDIPQSLLNFWEGSWKMQCSHSNGELLVAHNHVKSLWQKKILQEDITILNNNHLKGRGLTKYQPASGTWHHSFRSSDGGYLEFVGQYDYHQNQFVTRVKSIEEGSKEQRIQLEPCLRQTYQWRWQELDTERNAWYTSWHVQYRKLRFSL